MVTAETRKARKRPERTCLVCRGKFPKEELRRIALVGRAFVWDVHQRAGGRGAYVCAKPGCLERFERRQADFLQRAFRKKLNKERRETDGFFISPGQ